MTEASLLAGTAHNSKTSLVSLPAELQIQIMSHLLHVSPNGDQKVTQSMVKFALTSRQMRDVYSTTARHYYLKAIKCYKLSIIELNKIISALKQGHALSLTPSDLQLITEFHDTRCEVYKHLAKINKARSSHEISVQTEGLKSASWLACLTESKSPSLGMHQVLKFKLWQTFYPALNQKAIEMLERELQGFIPENPAHITGLNALKSSGTASLKIKAADAISRASLPKSA